MIIYQCALCDGAGKGTTLLRLKPTKWYACQRCVRQAGSRELALLGIINRLKGLILKGDPRMNDPAVLRQMQTLSRDLQRMFREARLSAVITEAS